MTETERIVDQPRRAFEGNAWSDPSLTEVLAGATAERAAARPIAGAHGIWENVLPIATWEEIVPRRLLGEVIVELPPEQDWPAIPEPTEEEAWADALKDLAAVHGRLLETVAHLAPSRLDKVVPGMGYSVYVMLYGVVQHALNHAGQIALLKKAQAEGIGW
jgi:uncharacterized damage-inducible protein DinB